MVTVQHFRKSILVLGLALVFFLNSCATAPKLTQPKRSKQSLETQTKSIADLVPAISPKQIRNKMDLFQKALNKGRLTERDWKLHDELLGHYIQLKQAASPQLTISANSRITLPLETYCLNAGRASPSENEVYHWQKSKPEIQYYSELLALRRKGEIKQTDLQEFLWNLGNETRWNDYPDRLKAILQKVDPKASIKLPSQLKDQATSLITDSAIGLPGASEVLDTYNFIKGKYYTYEDFKKSVESLVSKHDLSDHNNLTQIPGTELYSQSQSDGYSSQTVTFYNPTNQQQKLDLGEYYLAPERKDIQRIGISPTIKDLTLLTDLEKLLYETMARLGIGFTPVLGDVADLYEMIYGRNFLTGKSLSFDEQLASAVGVVLGSGSAYRHAKRWIHAPTEYLPKFESELAKVASKTMGQPSYSGARKILDDSTTSAKNFGKGLDYKGTQELSQFLRDASIHRDQRVQAVQSFDPTTIRRRDLEKNEIVYRWHNGDGNVEQYGRYVSMDKIEDSALARNQLALPEKNKMKYLDAFELKKGSTVFEGKVAPSFGRAGGGSQMLITGKPDEVLTFKERVM